MCPEAARSVRAGAGVRSYLEAPGQELVLHLQEVALVGLRLEGLVDDGKLRVVLDVLPPSVAVAAVGSVKGRTRFSVITSYVPPSLYRFNFEGKLDILYDLVPTHYSHFFK